MEKSVKKLRSQYHEYYDLAHSNQIKSKKMADIKASKESAIKAVQSVQENGQFQYLQEATFYQDKFQELEDAYTNAKKEQMKWSEFNPIAIGIFNQKDYVPGHSYIKSQIKNNNVSSPPAPPIQNRLISSFFQEKKSKLVPDVGFKSILENPPVTSKHFRKKAQSNNQQIDRLRAENADLRRKLESGGQMSIGDLERMRRLEQKLRQLQDNNETLYRENTRLKSQLSVTSGNSRKTYDDYLEAPYTLQPRQNDLYKINVRNYSEVGTIPDRNRFEGDSFNVANNLRDTYSNYSDNDSKRYSVFDMSKSYYSDQGDFNTSKLGIDNNRTVGKNKTAFFKKTGILIRQDEFEIAYKRSDPQEKDNFSSVRIILYFNNKTGFQKNIDTDYEYESNYYDLEVREKLREIKPFKQGREVVQIKLKPSATDVNSVIEATVSLDSKKFKIWVPAMFIKIIRKTDSFHTEAIGTKTILPHKYFKSGVQTKKVIEDAEGDRNDLTFWGKSRSEEGPIELHWKSTGKLVVRAPQKWVDFLSFVMFDFK